MWYMWVWGEFVTQERPIRVSYKTACENWMFFLQHQLWCLNSGNWNLDRLPVCQTTIGKQQLILMVSISSKWAAGRNQSTWRKPTQTQHEKFPAEQWICFLVGMHWCTFILLIPIQTPLLLHKVTQHHRQRFWWLDSLVVQHLDKV